MSTTTLQIEMFPCLRDNYGFLLHVAETGVTAVVDTPEVGPIENALRANGWRLTYILNTHHHLDHAGGNLELKRKYGCTIIGPRADALRIPGIDWQLAEGDHFDLGGHVAEIHDTPGHTRGHIVYHFRADKVAFVGDTLFALGCGRLFEGTPSQMWDSLQKILAWPDDTRIYCAHEYTQANARFALTVEPDNPDLVDRCQQIDQRRAQGLATIPTELGLEKRTNPFLRPDSDALARTIGMSGQPIVEVFARTRQLKDQF